MCVCARARIGDAQVRLGRVVGDAVDEQLDGDGAVRAHRHLVAPGAPRRLVAARRPRRRHARVRAVHVALRVEARPAPLGLEGEG